MKHARIFIQFGSPILYFPLLVFVFFIVFSACGDSAHGSNDPSSETGFIDFDVEWQGLNAAVSGDKSEEAEFSCATAGVATIEAEVLDDNDLLLAEGGPWRCEERGGTITGTKAGKNRTVVLLARNDSDLIIFRGEMTGITVTPGETANAGTITLIPVCQPPVLDPIGPQSVNEGELLEFTVTATDPNVGDVLTYRASNVPTGANFDPETQVFSWTPDYGDEGNYQVTFAVTDDCDPPLSDSEEVTITVGDTCRPPVLDPIGPQTTNEGQLLEFTITATDPDPGDVLTYQAGNLPAGANFDADTQTFTWTPGDGDEGNYKVIFTVTDDCDPPQSDFEEVTITVGVCLPPVLDPIGAQSVYEGETLTFTITATDPDPDDVLTFTADLSELPTESEPEFNPETQTFTWTPDYGDEGNYKVIFTVTDICDPPLSDFEEVTITVGDTCRPPVLNPIGSQSVYEGILLEFTITATDPDPGDVLTYTADLSDLPTESEPEFNPETQTFTWRPAYGDGGDYKVIFTVTDDCEPPLSDSEEVTITVVACQRPEIDPIDPQSVFEGELLQFTITATDTDTDSDDLTYSVEGGLTHLPGATFDPDTQTFSWTPGYDNAGEYRVIFKVVDDCDPPLSDAETVIITVEDVPCRPPELDPIGPKSVNEGKTLEFTITATDPNDGELTYDAEADLSNPLPAGANFYPETQTFSWTPGYYAAGEYQVIFWVTNNCPRQNSDFENVTITVGNICRPPELDHIGPKSVTEGELIQFKITARDPNPGDALTYSAGADLSNPLPAGATFNPQTQIFSWKTGPGDAGEYKVLFTVTDNCGKPLSVSEEVTITVCRPPVLDPIGAQSVYEGETLTFTITATDPDPGDVLTYSADLSELPTVSEPYFDPQTQTFTWTPGYEAAGNYKVIFTVTDNCGKPLSDSETVTITVKSPASEQTTG